MWQLAAASVWEQHMHSLWTQIKSAFPSNMNMQKADVCNLLDRRATVLLELCVWAVYRKTTANTSKAQLILKLSWSTQCCCWSFHKSWWAVEHCFDLRWRKTEKRHLYSKRCMKKNIIVNLPQRHGLPPNTCTPDERVNRYLRHWQKTAGLREAQHVFPERASLSVHSHTPIKPPAISSIKS